MSKGFVPCSDTKIKVKGKEEAWVQCVTSSDLAIHATNVKNLEIANKCLTEIIDNINLMAVESIKPAKCKWYKPFCKKRESVKEK